MDIPNDWTRSLNAHAFDSIDEEADRRSDASTDDAAPAELPVYTNDPYTLEHFREPSLNALISLTNGYVVYCLLVNRVHFLREQSQLVYQSVNGARATLCELVATRVLRRFSEDHVGQAGLLLLARILVQGHDPFQGAPSHIEREGRQLHWPIQDRGGHEHEITALELAILSESKTFIASSACQRVVDAVHNGQIVYTPLSFVDMLPDHYKHRPISLYDPHGARLLNHHRLIVPRIRAIVEMVEFLVLLALYVLTMVNRGVDRNAWELVFCVYTAGWALHEFAAVIEHGWEVHAQSLWAFLDATFVVVYAAYLLIRVYDFALGQMHDGFGMHILCVAAPVLLTRIAFTLLPDNIVFISLHAMMKDFTLVTFLAIWCFLGFLLALQWLLASDSSQNGDSDAPSWSTVSKWLLWIWFGLDGTGIEESTRFHIVFGPMLIIAFAFLGNTLFLTILVALLTNTFSRIVADEAAEIRFRRTVLTFEGVKSDAIFSYPPPLNILALAILLPIKSVVSARRFHTINVALIRLFNAPILLLITLFERRRLWARRKRPSKTWRFTGFSPHGDIQAVFETPLPEEVSDFIEMLDPMNEVPVLEDDVMSRLSGDATQIANVQTEAEIRRGQWFANPSAVAIMRLQSTEDRKQRMNDRLRCYMKKTRIANLELCGDFSTLHRLPASASQRLPRGRPWRRAP
ncbi:nonselective cation channel [Purpureocillium lavendulum]|uniref:Nonselective cation channel n=1 Tax=Purpureocillium lavendulum TaxID=1247861 RepID=A0AB34G0I3_9HYPO|nr:nonselective cation channel [Purpureocillium lavendulum]